MPGFRLLLKFGGDIQRFGDDLTGSEGLVFQDIPRVNAHSQNERLHQTILLLIERGNLGQKVADESGGVLRALEAAHDPVAGDVGHFPMMSVGQVAHQFVISQKSVDNVLLILAGFNLCGTDDIHRDERARAAG